MKQYQKLQVDCTPSVPARETRRMASILEPLVLILVPATLAVCAVCDYQQAALLTFVVAVAAIAVFFLSFERSKPALRQIMPTVVLAALAAAGRIIFAPIPDFKPVSATCIIAGATFGRQSGFMVGALAALVSNFFFGQGAWTPWQMYTWGLIGYIFGIAAPHEWFDKKPVLLNMGLPVGNALRLVAKRMVRHRIRASHYMADRASSLRSEIPPRPHPRHSNHALSNSTIFTLETEARTSQTKVLHVT